MECDIDQINSNSDSNMMSHDENSEIDSLKIYELMRKVLQKDDYWYLIEKKWYERLRIYLSDKTNVNNPGPIDNGPLFRSLTDNHLDIWELRERLQEEVDYIFVPEECWKVLLNTFNIISPKHEIRRQVIQTGNFASYCTIELYSIELKLCLYGSKEDIILQSFSRVTPLHKLETEMKRLFNIDSSKETQLWASGDVIKPHDENQRLKSLDSRSLFDAGLYTGAIVTLEVRNLDGTWPSSKPRYGAVATRSSKCTPGLCGLMNLGNTCFMNSALQCMSNTPPLTDYFVTDKYWEELNVDNPLGMRGEIAKSFGDLMKAMWSGSHTCLAPREFKHAVGRFAPQFSGFQQQDCQELMAFLLDGLHEDLNRVKQKPYIESKTEVEKRADKIVAAESWENYKKRNDSVIVDTFHGLLKSTLVCPECHLVSVTFDPFCYLSLPLPVKPQKAIDVTFVPSVTRIYMNGNQNVKALQISRLLIPKQGIIMDICNAVAKIINDNHEPGYIDPEKLVVAEVCNHRFHRLYSSEDAYSHLDDVVVYELVDKCIPVVLYLREVKSDDTTTLFGRPMLINVQESTFDSLNETVSLYLKQYMKIPSDDEESDTDEGVAECERTDLFYLSMVNNYGSVSIERIERNKPFKLTPRCYIAADFASAMKEKYYDAVEAESSLKIMLQRQANSGKSSICLSDCIAQFTTTERLGADDPWYCPRCKKHQQATKKFDIWSLPKVLIIHLKRFSYSRATREKLEVYVDFPISDLNMADYIINNPNNEPELYELNAVANHFGGLGGGHYTAICKNRETGQWHNFDDSNVTLTTEESVASKSAYCLFYLRK